jgi:O-acetylserine/cysteine efflux transporter
LRERWGLHQLAGLVLAGAGLVLIGSAHGVSMPLAGFALSIAAASMWAMGNIVTRFITERAKVQTREGAAPLDLFAFIVWSSLIPPLPFLALSLWLEGWPRIEVALLNLSWASLAAVAYLAWMATLLGYGLWTRLLSRYPANQVAPFSLLVPVVGVFAGWLLFDERLQAVHWAGGALLMLGLAVNVFGARLFARWGASNTQRTDPS